MQGINCNIGGVADCCVGVQKLLKWPVDWKKEVGATISTCHLHYKWAGWIVTIMTDVQASICLFLSSQRLVA